MHVHTYIHTYIHGQEEEDLADARATIAVNRKQQKNLDFERNQQCGNVMRQLIEAGSVLEDMFDSYHYCIYCTYIYTHIYTYILCLTSSKYISTYILAFELIGTYIHIHIHTYMHTHK